LQVGFAALCVEAAPYGVRDQAAELVLAHHLSTGALWEDIRMKGGAYGAFAQPDSMERVFSLSTYRDPKPRRSLESFGPILEAAGAERIGGEALEKGIIGTYARETRPRTGAEKSFGDFLAFLHGVEHEHRRRKLRDLISLEPEDLAAAARRLAAFPAPSRVIIAGSSGAEKAARALGVEPRELPV
jgi:Zn-dependent M16 (insulinase) family peptidase